MTLFVIIRSSDVHLQLRTIPALRTVSKFSYELRTEGCNHQTHRLSLSKLEGSLGMN